MYTQNNEEEVILKYFNGRLGNVLDVGANDGKTFSNSLALVEAGWVGVMVEPDEDAFKKLLDTHDQNLKAYCYNIAITDTDGDTTFYKSGSHINGNDTGLLSTTTKEDYEKWKGSTEFTKTITKTLKFDTFISTCPIKYFNFITIDAEGKDWDILKQIDLKEYQCEMVCIEHNGIEIDKYITYCEVFGMKEIMRNAENLIMAR